MGKIKRFIAILFISALLVGCSNLKNGTVVVVKKDYLAPYTMTNYMYVNDVAIPHISYYDEEYRLIVKQYDSENDEYIRDTIAVSKSFYKEVEIGEELVYKNGALSIKGSGK